MKAETIGKLRNMLTGLSDQDLDQFFDLILFEIVTRGKERARKKWGYPRKEQKKLPEKTRAKETSGYSQEPQSPG